MPGLASPICDNYLVSWRSMQSSPGLFLRQACEIRAKGVERLMEAPRLEQEALKSKQKAYGYASEAFLGENTPCSPGNRSQADKETSVGLH